MKESRSVEWFTKYILDNPQLSPDAVLSTAKKEEHAAIADAYLQLLKMPLGAGMRPHLTPDETYDFLRIKQAARARDMIDCARIDSDKFRREGNHQKDRAEKLEPDATSRRKQRQGRVDAVKVHGKHRQPKKNETGKLNPEYETDYRSWIAKGKKPDWVRNQIANDSGLQGDAKKKFKDSLRQYANRNGWNE